jgi:hypothetical protein
VKVHKVISIGTKKVDYTADLGQEKAAGFGGQCNATSVFKIMVNFLTSFSRRSLR